jgi:ribonuclease BN (tRNA processing enzyme)
VHGSWIELPPDLLVLREIVPDAAPTLDLPFGSLSALPMAHTAESLGYRLQTRDGLSLAYSGDTDYCANVVALAGEADLFFCECAFPDQLKSEGHLTPRWAGRVAREAGCKRLVLTHLYPACDDIDVMADCSQEFSGEIVVAEDLMWFHLSEPHSHPLPQE